MKPAEAIKIETVLDDATRRVASVYAEALLNVAQQRGEAFEVMQELDILVHDLFDREPTLEGFFKVGANRRSQTRENIHRLFDGRAGETFVDFLLMLSDHGRTYMIRAIAAAYRRLYDKRRNRVPVRVRTATPLADDQRERLLKDLAETFRCEPLVDVKVDPDILGGITVQVGDWLFDASVRTRLNEVREQLIERSKHEFEIKS